MKAKAVSTIDNLKDPTMEHVYTDETGHKWFAHKNLLELSPSRGVTAARADRFVGLRLTQENLTMLVNTAIEGINDPVKPDFVQASAILYEIKHRLEFLTEENSLLDLAAVYYFLQDESAEFPSEHHNKLKVEIWNRDAKCRGFFLHMGIALTKQFSDTSEIDLISFMEKAKETAERIYRFIPRPSMPNFPST